MTAEKRRLRSAAPLPVAGLVVLALVAGTALSLVALGCGSPSPTPEVPSATPTLTPNATQIALWTATPPPASPTPTGPTPAPSPTPCPSPPAGWVPYTVEPGDTLSELAVLAGVSQEQIVQVNCLTSPELVAGQVLALPPLPTPTPCGTVPAGWEPYTVQPGDTLFSLASRAGVSQEQIMQINCLASSQLQAGQALYLPPLPTPTPTPCAVSPPPGWVLYTIRPGDTLFSLAVTRETTTDQVIRVNCLTSDNILEGNTLYLPPLPFALETPVAPPPSSPGEGGEARVELPTWKLDSGAPGAADVLTACHFTVPTQWVDRLAPLFPRPSQPEQTEKVQLGERRFFFACAFPATPATATVTMSDGQIQTVALSESLPNLDLAMGTAQAVVDWPALPTYPTGRYTLTITDSEGNHADTFFDVLAPTTPRILTVPSAGAPQTPFQVYYVDFGPDTNPELDFCQVERTVGPLGEIRYSPIACVQRSVPIDRKLDGAPDIGWARESLSFQAANLPAPFVIAYQDAQSYTLFWLR